MSDSKVYGADVGTMFFQTATKGNEDKLVIKTTRNAFVEVADIDDIEDTLRQNGWQYIRDGDRYFVIGEDSIRVAKMFPGQVELRRPLQDGVLNKNEDKKMLILAELIESSIGQASGPNDVVCTCVSSEAVDEATTSTFHKARLEAMFSRLGYNVVVIEEGLAVIFAENPTIEEDSKTFNFSGIGISCLSPETKIYTDKGIVKMEDVAIGDKVITHKGRWKTIFNKIKKQFSGNSVKLAITGYSDDFEYEFVDNHEIYVYRSNTWQWIGSENVNIGDIVGEPIVKKDFNSKPITLNICNRITNSKKWDKKQVESCSNVQRFIGYFLGDGSVSTKTNIGLTFDFGLHEEKYAQDVLDIASNNFAYNGGVIEVYNDDKYGGKRLRVKLYNKGLGTYFRNKFYDENGEKIYPWDISKLSHSETIGLLSGLIRSDGCIKKDGISFCNTSTDLILICKQLFSRLNVATSISYREPREHKLESGRIIKGKKRVWELNVGSKMVFHSLIDIINSVDIYNSKFIERIFIDGSFCCGKIKNIEISEYNGDVYDLQVEDDHSFSGPMLTIHNCGAGRINCVLAYKGMPIVGMSSMNSGDWIDETVSSETGKPISQVTSMKENKLDLSKDNYDDEVLFALTACYKAMISNVIKKFSKKFVEVKSEFDVPLDVVIAGGTSMPKGFCEVFENIVRDLDLPFEIRNVKKSSDPRNSVVKGCLRRAIIANKKILKESNNTG